MDRVRVALLRELLSSTAWVDRTRGFARELRRGAREGDAILLVGTPTEEPWHLAAHLDEESRYAQLPGLSPTLVRFSAPPGAPPHLAVTLERLEAARTGDTVLVVAPDDPGAALLERVDDARRTGAVVLSLDTGDDDLGDLAHDRLVVPAAGLLTPQAARAIDTTSSIDDALLGADVSFETVQHLVSVAAGELDAPSTTPTGRVGLRDRLGRMLDRISGDTTPHDW